MDGNPLEEGRGVWERLYVQLAEEAAQAGGGLAIGRFLRGAMGPDDLGE